MKHYGDITKISGTAAPPVNVIIGGSPCQDLSVAGKQKGIKHTDNDDGETTRSGLFMEQLRIIKEMRCNDIEHGRTGTNIRPRYMVWENVPGAFSSNKGTDFAVVLEETIKVICKETPAVSVPKNGWPNAGCLTDMDGKWSVAWRVFDAQFWGVPQRRKGSHLSQILEDSPHPKYFLSARACLGILNRADRKGKILPPKLREALEKQSGLSAFKVTASTAPTPPDATAKDGQRELATHSTPWTVQPSQSLTPERCQELMDTTGKLESAPLSERRGGDNRPAVILEKDAIPIDLRNATRNTAFGDACGVGIGERGDPAFTVTADQSHAVAYGICSMASNSMNSNNPHSGIYEAQTARTLDLNGGNPGCNQGGIFILEHHPQDSRVRISDNDVVQTLSAKMGMGGGNVPLLMTPPVRD